MKIAIKLLAFGLLFFGTVVGAQDYELSVSTPYYSAIPKNAVRLPMLEITVDAKTDLFLSDIWIKASGMASADDFDSIWAETDDYYRSMRTGFFNDNQAKIRFFTPVFIPAGTSKKIEILVNLDVENTGRSFGLSLEKISFNNEESATSRSYFSNINRGRTYTKIPSLSTRNIKTSSFVTPSAIQTQRLTSFDVTEVEFEMSGSTSKISMGRHAEIGKFRLVNGNKNIQLRTIRFRNYGNSDLEKSFDNFVIQQNGRNISTQATVNKDYLTFDLNNYFLGKGDSVMLSVQARLIYAKRNATVQLAIKGVEDFTATVQGTNFGARLTGFEGVKLKEHTLSPGGITTYFSSNYKNYRNSRANYAPTYRASDVYSPGSRDVLFLSKFLTQKNDFTVDGVFFPINSSTNVSDKDGNGIANEISDLETSFNSFQLFVGDVEIDSTNDFVSRGGQIGLEFDTNFDIFSQTQIRIFGRITNNAVTGDKLKFNRNAVEFYSPEAIY